MSVTVGNGEQAKSISRLSVLPQISNIMWLLVRSTRYFPFINESLVRTEISSE